MNMNNGCPNLSSLALSHCENLTDNGLAELCATHKVKINKKNNFFFLGSSSSFRIG